MDNIFPYVNSLHTLGAVIWVGGMIFAWGFLRPSLGFLSPPERLGVWSKVFPKFFMWVWISVIVMPVTGYSMVYYDFGSFSAAGYHVELMHILGWVMIVLFIFVYFVPYKKFKISVAGEAWPDAAIHLGVIRRTVATNMILGIVNITIGVSGRFWG